MESKYVLLVVFMLACWAVAGYMIWKWGPGMRRRSVECPEKGLRAKVLVEQVEGDFNCLRTLDVKACSLKPGQALTCDRQCLRLL